MRSSRTPPPRLDWSKRGAADAAPFSFDAGASSLALAPPPGGGGDVRPSSVGAGLRARPRPSSWTRSPGGGPDARWAVPLSYVQSTRTRESTFLGLSGKSPGRFEGRRHGNRPMPISPPAAAAPHRSFPPCAYCGPPGQAARPAKGGAHAGSYGRRGMGDGGDEDMPPPPRPWLLRAGSRSRVFSRVETRFFGPMLGNAPLRHPGRSCFHAPLSARLGLDRADRAVSFGGQL